MIKSQGYSGMMVLVDQHSGEPVARGTERTDFRGERWIITGGRAPHREGSTGRVLCRPIHLATSHAGFDTHTYFPSVLDCEWRRDA